MLHDQRRDLTLLSFRDFADSKDPNEKYDYSNRCECACGQFAKHIGLTYEWDNVSLSGPNIWAEMNRLAFGAPWPAGSANYPTVLHTWGALCERIDAELQLV